MKTRFAMIDATASGLGDLVFDELAAAILDGRLEPGQRLRDADLAEALAVSRTPVREAVQRLARMGMVEVVANRFTRVSTPSPQSIAETLTYTGYQAGVAAHMAVARMSSDEREAALHLVDAMIDASSADDAATLYIAARALVSYLTGKASNGVLVTVMRETGLAMERNLQMARPLLLSLETRNLHYQGLRDAIARGDADAAERWIRLQHGIGAPVTDAG